MAGKLECDLKKFFVHMSRLTPTMSSPVRQGLANRKNFVKDMAKIWANKKVDDEGSEKMKQASRIHHFSILGTLEISNNQHGIMVMVNAGWKNRSALIAPLVPCLSG